MDDDSLEGLKSAVIRAVEECIDCVLLDLVHKMLISDSIR